MGLNMKKKIICKTMQPENPSKVTRWPVEKTSQWFPHQECLCQYICFQEYFIFTWLSSNVRTTNMNKFGKKFAGYCTRKLSSATNFVSSMDCKLEFVTLHCLSVVLLSITRPLKNLVKKINIYSQKLWHISTEHNNALSQNRRIILPLKL